MDKSLTKRALRKAATRASVIEAARAVFAQRGYAGATISDIAKAANVSPGTVLNAAPTKISLLNDVMVSDFQALGADCATLAASLASPAREKIAALLDLHLKHHCEALELFAALLGHTWLEGGEEFEALYRNLDEAWAPILELIRAEQEAGRLRGALDPVETVRLLQDVYIGVVRRCAAQQSHDLFEASAAMRRGLDLVLDGAIA